MIFVKLDILRFFTFPTIFKAVSTVDLNKILLYNLILSHKTIKVADNRHRWTLFICQCVFKKSCKEKSISKAVKEIGEDVI